MDRPIAVYVVGVFDLFHVGHLNVLQLAKRLGDILIVGVSTDEYARSYGKHPIIPFEQRRRIIEALRCVDVVLPHKYAKDYDAIDVYDVNIRVVSPHYGDYGRSKVHEEARRELEQKGVRYVILPRTSGVSTTEIKERIKKHE